MLTNGTSWSGRARVLAGRSGSSEEGHALSAANPAGVRTVERSGWANAPSNAAAASREARGSVSTGRSSPRCGGASLTSIPAKTRFIPTRWSTTRRTSHSVHGMGDAYCSRRIWRHEWQASGAAGGWESEATRPRGPAPEMGTYVILRHVPTRRPASWEAVARKQSPEAWGAPRHRRGDVVVTTPTKV